MLKKRIVPGSIPENVPKIQFQCTQASVAVCEMVCGNGVVGLVSAGHVQGQNSFLTMIDMYTGFVIAVTLNNETTSEIVIIIENPSKIIASHPR